MEMNLKKDHYLAHTQNGITYYIHRPCPVPTLEQQGRALVLAKAVIATAQLSAALCIQEYNALLEKESHHD